MIYSVKKWINNYYKLYIVFFVLILIACFSTRMKCIHDGKELNFKALIYCFYKGDKIIDIKNGKDIFRIPPLYLIFNIFIAAITVIFSNKNTDNFEKNIILRYGSKSGWWIKKSFSLFIAIYSFYLLTLISFGTYSLFLGKSIVTDKKIFFTVYVFMPMISYTVSSTQMLIDRISGSIIGFIMVFFMLIISVCYDGFFGFGKYLMLERYSNYNTAFVFIPVFVGISIIVLIIGKFLIKKSDMI